MESLITKEDPNHPERKIIVSTYNDFEQYPNCADLKHSLLQESLDSSRRMYRKAKKMDKLQDIEKQILKQTENGYVEIMTREHAAGIAKGEIAANFTKVNFVEKAPVLGLKREL